MTVRRLSDAIPWPGRARLAPIGSAALMALLALLVAVLLLVALSPKLFGIRYVIIAGGSMEPTIGLGSVAVMRDISGDGVAPGDVIKFRDPAFPGRIVTHRAVSTSGDTEQFAEIGGRRYSHVVDPRTGRALTSRIQVTVTAADGLTADPLSTAVSVLGEAEGRRLLRRYPGCEAYIRVLPLGPSSVR